MKKILFLSIGFLLGIGAFVAHAYPITPIYGGGTQTSTAPAYGYLLIGNASNTYSFIASSSIGCPTCLSTTTGNWQGTWQLYNPSDFKSSSTSSGGSVSTSSAVTQYNFPFWANTTGGLSGTSTIYFSSSTGNIGIGAFSDGFSALDVVTADPAMDVTHFQNTASSGYSNNAYLDDGGNYDMYFGHGNSATGDVFQNVNYISNVQVPFTVFTGNNGTAQAFTVATNSYVGIGTTVPSSTLHVVGTARVSSNLTLDNVAVNSFVATDGNHKLVATTTPATGLANYTVYPGTNITVSTTSVSATVSVSSSPSFSGTLTVLGSTTLATTTTGLLSPTGAYSFASSSATNSSTVIDFSLHERYDVILNVATTTLSLKNFAGKGNTPNIVCTLQNATGSETVSWSVNSSNASTSVDWGTAGVPTLSTAAKKKDCFSFYMDIDPTAINSSTIIGMYGSNGF